MTKQTTEQVKKKALDIFGIVWELALYSLAFPLGLVSIWFVGEIAYTTYSSLVGNRLLFWGVSIVVGLYVKDYVNKKRIKENTIVGMIKKKANSFERGKVNIDTRSAWVKDSYKRATEEQKHSIDNFVRALCDYPFETLLVKQRNEENDQ